MQRVGVLMPFAPDDPETRMRVAALEQGLRNPGAGSIAATSASIIAGRPTIPTACAARRPRWWPLRPT
jgi:hypothetical protein